VSSGPASEGSLEPAYPARRAGVLGPVALVVLVGLATVVGGVLTGDVLVTLTPAVGALVVWAMIRSPLRWQVAILLFLCLALEVAGDASDIVHTPLLFPGMLLMDTSGAALKVKVAGGELLAFFLIGLALHRRMARSTIDGRGFVPMPSATRDVLLVYAVGFVYTVGMSYATGHGLPPWKARYLIHFVLFFALFHLSLRDLPDFRAMGRAVIAAAHVKAFLAMWVQYSAAPRLTGGELAFATNHGDSILFVMAIAIAVIPALEGTSRRAWRRALWTVPIPFWGVLLNHRRIAYAMLELGFVLVYLYSPWNRWKKRFTTVAIFGAPLLIAYLALGWNSNGGGIFAPVHKVRTMVDGSVDPSTYWRDVEAWNIASTLRDRSPLGVGLGGEYVEYMFNDDISAGYADFRGWPHNTVLGMLLYAGVPGFALLWIPNLLIVFFAVRSYRMARTADERAAALIAIVSFSCCAILSWGDTGAHFWQHKLAMGLTLALVGKLAIRTGAWPQRAAAAPAVSAQDAAAPG